MINRTHALTFVIAAAVLAVSVWPLSVRAKDGNLPGTVAFRDAATDELTSDGLGPYTNGAAGAAVFFQSGGNIEVDLRSSSRALDLKFSIPDTSLNQSFGLNPNPALYSGPKHAVVTQGVLNPDGTCCSSTGLLGMNSGEIAQSFLAIHFVDATGRACQVIFGKPAPGYQNTNDATVVRNADGTWTLTTFATDVAKLTCNGKGNTVTTEGYFYLPTQYVIRKN